MIFQSGKIVWTCMPSNESSNYGDATPCKPYQAKLVAHQRPGGIYWEVHRFKSETGEVDYDSNATAVVDPRYNQVFETRDEAVGDYCKACRMLALQFRASADELEAKALEIENHG